MGDDRSRLRRDRTHRPAVTSSAAVAAVASVTSVSAVPVVANRFGLFRRFIPHNSAQKSNTNSNYINNFCIYSDLATAIIYTEGKSCQLFHRKPKNRPILVEARFDGQREKKITKFSFFSLTGPPRPQRGLYSSLVSRRNQENNVVVWPPFFF